jgi:hypothetical protein
VNQDHDQREPGAIRQIRPRGAAWLERESIIHTHVFGCELDPWASKPSNGVWVMPCCRRENC